MAPAATLQLAPSEYTPHLHLSGDAPDPPGFLGSPHATHLPGDARRCPRPVLRRPNPRAPPCPRVVARGGRPGPARARRGGGPLRPRRLWLGPPSRLVRVLSRLPPAPVPAGRARPTRRPSRRCVGPGRSDGVGRARARARVGRQGGPARDRSPPLERDGPIGGHGPGRPGRLRHGWTRRGRPPG